MVANNPLFRGTWTAKKFGATVIDDTWPEVIFFTLIATMVVLVSEKTSVDLGVSNQLLTVLGLVLGLVISFRTSSAYERYQEGRKMWTTIMVASKNISQMIWIHVPDQRKDSTPIESVIEKKTMINLVQAFSVSVKVSHLLRGEQGVYYEDLYPLISFLPRYISETGDTEFDEASKLPLWHAPEGFETFKTKVNPEFEPKNADREKSSQEEKSSGSFSRARRVDTFDPEALLPQINSEQPLRPARNPPHYTILDYIPMLRIFPWTWGILTRKPKGPLRSKKRKAYAEVVESHIPLEISLVLSNYSGWLMRSNLVQPAIASGLTNNIFLLQDTVSNLERICNTPLPFAYQAHLRMSLWLYLLLLPFQIYTSYGVITIPATAFASFLLLGFLEIGQEIENPFNYDLNDLDLDYFCLSLQRELHEITAHVNPDLNDYIFTHLNQPLAPSDRRHAAELVRDSAPYSLKGGDPSAEPGIGSIRRTLVTGWKMVDTLTRGK